MVNKWYFSSMSCLYHSQGLGTSTTWRSLYVFRRFGGFYYWTHNMNTWSHVFIFQEIHNCHILSSTGRKMRSLECLDSTPGLALHPTTFEIGPRHLGQMFQALSSFGALQFTRVGISPSDTSCIYLHYSTTRFSLANAVAIFYYRLWLHLNFTYACDCQQIQRTPMNRLFAFHVVLILPRKGKHGCR